MKNELVTKRTINAPVEKIWTAWTNPIEFAKWWAPKPFQVNLIQIDLRVNGKYLMGMTSPTGQEIYSAGYYTEIIPMKKITCIDHFSDSYGNKIPATQYGLPNDFPLEIPLTVEFEKLEKKTRLKITQTGIPKGEMTKQAQTGWDKVLNQLEENTTTH